MSSTTIIGEQRSNNSSRKRIISGLAGMVLGTAGVIGGFKTSNLNVDARDAVYQSSQVMQDYRRAHQRYDSFGQVIASWDKDKLLEIIESNDPAAREGYQSIIRAQKASKNEMSETYYANKTEIDAKNAEVRKYERNSFSTGILPNVAVMLSTIIAGLGAARVAATAAGYACEKFQLDKAQQI